MGIEAVRKREKSLDGKPLVPHPAQHRGSLKNNNMEEKELIEALNKALEPIQSAHQEYLVKVMEAVKNALELGIDIGKSLKK